MGIIDSILKKVVLQEALIVEKTKLSDAAYKIRLKSEGIASADFVPGYFSCLCTISQFIWIEIEWFARVAIFAVVC